MTAWLRRLDGRRSPNACSFLRTVCLPTSFTSSGTASTLSRRDDSLAPVEHPMSADPPDPFKRGALRRRGFEGFLKFKGIDFDDLPEREGVYVVLRESDEQPAFLERST